MGTADVIPSVTKISRGVSKDISVKHSSTDSASFSHVLLLLVSGAISLFESSPDRRKKHRKLGQTKVSV